ncbi:hypothetical protein D3C85_1644050 [compost metagenome]
MFAVHHQGGEIQRVGKPEGPIQHPEGQGVHAAHHIVFTGAGLEEQAGEVASQA